ncbi:MAG TPA: hydrogenase small subunit, partial [Verrucomicrobiae bacterium]|nr:hydrogenase small subunit [Verrucomicrobiae bacterium]
RDFMKLCAAVTAAMGLPSVFEPEVAKAVESAIAKPAVIWLEGQDCAGCSESTIATLNPSAAEVVLDMISLRYHETIMAGTGDVAREAFEQTVKAGKYVLIVEGSIPKENDKYCMIGGEPFRKHVEEAAKNAAVILAIGSCAAYGGIPAATPSKGVGVSEIVKDKLVINLPSCPVKPSRLIGTIVYYLTFQKAPELDSFGRPKAFYGMNIHENCPRRGHFENGEFLEDWNDSAKAGWCLLLKGCKGPKTYADCGQVWWNDNVNYCINAGSPCAGCAQPEFYNGFSPLYQKQDSFKLPGIGQVNPDSVGKAVGGAAAVGVAAHLAGSAISGRLGKEENKAKEGGK